MVHRTLIILLSALIIACSDSSRSLDGYWVDQKGKAIAEFTGEKIVITLLGDSENQYVVDYEKIDESRFHLKGGGLGVSPVLVVDWQRKSFSIPSLFGKKKELSFVQAPDVSASDINGTWYTHEKEDNYESSIIVTQKDSSYDYDSLDIDHSSKTFTKRLDLNVQSNFTNGFIFNDPDPETGEEYTYYLTSYSTNTMSFTDSSGYQWSQHRKLGATHIDIPEGYKEGK